MKKISRTGHDRRMIGVAKRTRRSQIFHFSDAVAGRLRLVPFNRPPLLSNIGRFRRTVRCIDKIFISRFAARARANSTKSVSRVIPARLFYQVPFMPPETYLSVRQRYLTTSTIVICGINWWIRGIAIAFPLALRKSTNESTADGSNERRRYICSW